MKRRRPGRHHPFPRNRATTETTPTRTSPIPTPMRTVPKRIAFESIEIGPPRNA
jgi:hypothetical protein